MKTTISTSHGVSKLVYQGMTLGYLDQSELESLRADIWMALMEMELATGLGKEYEKQHEVA